MAPNKTTTKRTADIFFANGSNLDASPETNLLSNIPNRTGTVTIKKISRYMLNKEIFSVILD